MFLIKSFVYPYSLSLELSARKLTYNNLVSLLLR